MSISTLASSGFKTGQRVHHVPRRMLLSVADAVVAVSAFLISLLLHGGQSGIMQSPGIWMFLVIAAAAKISMLSVFRVYRLTPRFLNVNDTIKIVTAVTAGSALFSFFYFLLSYLGSQEYSISLLVDDFLLTVMGVCGVRAAIKLQLRKTQEHTIVSLRNSPQYLRRTLIAGAGSAAELTIRSILQEKSPDCLPVAIVDDAPEKQGITIDGIPVLGMSRDIPRLVRKLEIEELLIAIPSAPASVLKKFTELGKEAGLKKIRILPAFTKYINGNGTLNTSLLRDVKVEDLLGRDPVKINTCEIQNYLKGSVVLVTGGAGSIGSELCRQIASFEPEQMVIFDQDETALFYLRQSLVKNFPRLNLAAVVGDIQDKAQVHQTYLRFRPEIVFHAAAYKHVGMMEENPAEALKNNVLGSLVVAEAACIYGTSKFVLISTDKAVNPTCIMGATKRLAEIIIRDLNERGTCKFMAVRFGNVLGSRGSVVPIFHEQIQNGGPVTVTHPDMRRYFMVPSEAALLVLQAGAMGKGGEVFVLDMGEPVSILDLAKEMIKLAGYEPDKDIPIVFTQPSQGEKLFEDILTAEEGTLATKHERIFTARVEANKMGMHLDDPIYQIQEAVNQGDTKYAIEILCDLVPNFQYSGNHANHGTCETIIPGERMYNYQMDGIQGRFHSGEGVRRWG